MEVALGMLFGVAVGKGAMGMLFGEMREGGDSNGAGDKSGSFGVGLICVGVGEAARLCAVDDREDEKPKVEIVP